MRNLYSVLLPMGERNWTLKRKSHAEEQRKGHLNAWIFDCLRLCRRMWPKLTQEHYLISSFRWSLWFYYLIFSISNRHTRKKNERTSREHSTHNKNETCPTGPANLFNFTNIYTLLSWWLSSRTLDSPNDSLFFSFRLSLSVALRRNSL